MNPVKMTVVTPCHAGYQTSKLLFCQVLDTSNTGSLTLYSTDTQETAIKNMVGKGEFACNEQFLLFPQCFLLNQIIVSPFVHIFYIISFFAAESEEPKISLSSKGSNHYQATKS